MLLSERDAVRPRATAAIAARSVAARTMRGLRSLMETQLPSRSASASPTQRGLSEAGRAPSTPFWFEERGTNGVRLVAGNVSTIDAASTRVTAASNSGRSDRSIKVAPTPATTRHASATRSWRRKRGVG